MYSKQIFYAPINNKYLFSRIFLHLKQLKKILTIGKLLLDNFRDNLTIIFYKPNLNLKIDILKIQYCII